MIDWQTSTAWVSAHYHILRHTFRWIAITALALLGTLYVCERQGLGSATTILLQLAVAVLVQIISILLSFWADDWTGWQL